MPERASGWPAKWGRGERPLPLHKHLANLQAAQLELARQLDQLRSLEETCSVLELGWNRGRSDSESRRLEKLKAGTEKLKERLQQREDSIRKAKDKSAKTQKVSLNQEMFEYNYI